MQTLDWVILTIYFFLMIILGVWSYFKNVNTEDYFVAGGKMPWWMAGISHHISGHSAATFVAFAGLAYAYGFSVYVWWAFSIGISIIAFAKIFPVYWVQSRIKLAIQSPLEFLAVRYNVSTQQILAWSGILLKIFDIAAKWAAIAILLKVLTGLPILTGILITGVITVLYVTFGGLIAVMATDVIQFIIQVAAGIVMFVIVVIHFGGVGSITGMWEQLPPSHDDLFNSPYTLGFAILYLLVNFTSYNGGTWGLANRYISTPSKSQAYKGALLSGALYLIWPLILFFPMWAGPIIFPNLSEPSYIYAKLMLDLLPVGFLGLVAASLFAATMAMVASDISAISAVITRDILPTISKKFKEKRNSLIAARVITFIYSVLTILIASQYEQFGGVIGLMVSWFGALFVPTALPLLFGLLPIFRTCGPRAAISTIIVGIITFIIVQFISTSSLAITVGLPGTVSFVVYIGFAWFNRNKEVPPQVVDLVETLRPNNNSFEKQ